MYYDITQEVFSGGVYPGDASPSFVRAKSMERGDECNVTDFAMCAHNGTHIDAPAHYIAGGKTVESLELSRFAGKCVVCSAESAAAALGAGARRLLLKGKEEITAAFAARLRGKLLLLGVEGQSVGSAEAHRILLEDEIALLEGIDLSAVPEGEYELYAFPLKLGGADGAPVRAVLKSLEENE